ncbi:MAG: site-specific integrase [Deltaproteobacteria bacterium]
MRVSSPPPSFEAFLQPVPDPVIWELPEAAGRWLAHEAERLKRGDIRPSTMEAFRSFLRQHLIPQFGRFKVHQITTRHLEAWVAALKSCRAGSTVRTQAVYSRTFFKFCEDSGAIERSPWRDFPGGVLPPKGPQDKTKRPREVLSPEAVARVIYLTPDFDERALFTGALLGMLRPGELFEARWFDYDAQARRLNVARSWRSKGRTVGPTKSGEPRDVAVHPLFKAILDTTFARRTLERGEAPPSDELIFMRDGRHRWMQGCAIERWRKNLDALGIPPVTGKQRDMYSARHTGVTQLRLAGAPKDLVQAMTHTCTGAERFDKQSAFGWYDHSGEDFAARIRAVDLLELPRSLIEEIADA